MSGSLRRRQRRGAAVAVVILLAGLVIVAIPYLWILLTAFKRPVDAASVPPEIFSPTTLANFQAVFHGPYLQSLLNSVIITVGTTIATLVFGVPAGYAFARGRFLGRRFLGGWLLFSRMVHHPALPVLSSAAAAELVSRACARLPHRAAAVHDLDDVVVLP
jgi:ABC-type glycerol-3-phosphate transport system permease component